jgi:hypothetical protein
MKLSTSSKRTSLLTRVGGAVVALAAAIAVAGSGCDTGAEGERCNPLLSHDECGAGLQCLGAGALSGVQIPDCPEAYCCPPPTNTSPYTTTSTNPYCQAGCNGGLAAICNANPTASPDCPTDAGEAGGGDDGSGSEGAAPEGGGMEAAAPEGGGTEAAPPEGGGMEAAPPEAGGTEAGAPDGGSNG